MPTRVRSFCKINLGLAIGPARPDGFHALTTLNPGQTVKYGIELYLPTTAGNVDQGLTAAVTFEWQAG